MNSSNKESGDSAKKKARRERATKYGPPGLAEKLNPLSQPDEWTIEKKKRHDEAKKQYFKDKQRLHVQERHARARLKAQLASRKNTIDARYKVESLKESDPRLEKARRMARRSFARYQRKTERQHHDQFKKSHRNLRSNRDKQYRNITKTMKKDSRRERGLPDAMQSPWKM